MANADRFEVFPRKRHPGSKEAGQDLGFAWRFRGGNGKIQATSGEGFTRREDAHRSVEEFCASLDGMIYESQTDAPSNVVATVIDVDD